MLHLFAIGGLRDSFFAMITRVTMGHTGRAIYKGPSMALAFSAIFIAALVRSLGVTFPCLLI
ncbi:NnrS family protein [Vibrio lentus]|nr:NnrS family protein [Vibrio lentus]